MCTSVIIVQDKYAHPMSEHRKPIPQFIRRAIPDAKETELLEAAETFEEYMDIVWKIVERIFAEGTRRDSPTSDP